jgi:hypothetical protein
MAELLAPGAGVTDIRMPVYARVGERRRVGDGDAEDRHHGQHGGVRQPAARSWASLHGHARDGASHSTGPISRAFGRPWAHQPIA